MAASGFPANVLINLIGFRYSVAQSVPTTGDFKVYLENTNDTVYTKVSNVWADIITPMTLAHNNPVTIPAAVGFWDIPFVNGSPFTYTGGALYVAFEYQNPAGTISTGNTALCNNTLANSLKNAFSTSTLPTSVGATASAFRPGTRLGNPLTDVVEVIQLYTLGKVALPSGNPVQFSAVVKNKNTSAISFDVVLTAYAFGGTVRFTDTKTVTNLLADSSQTVVFAGWNAGMIEIDSVKVEVAVQPGETFTFNNSRANVLNLNEDTFGYSQGTTPSGGVGFNGATVDFVAKFTVNTNVTVDQITVNFSTGGQPYQVGIWDDDGVGGVPGTNLYTSSSMTSTAGVTSIPVSPPVPVNGSFFVGVKQTGTTNVSFAYQTESPIRSGVFYYTSPTGGTTWTDFAPASAFRFMIEPRVVDGPIPVELSSFTASVQEGNVTLNWSTASETNNKGFEVQRGINGVYTTLSFVEGKGTTTEIQRYMYVDAAVEEGNYTYRLKQIDYDGTFEYSNAVEAEVVQPKEYTLEQNYPNPFNPTTSINFSLASDSKVNLRIYDILGQEVVALLNTTMSAGRHKVNFDASTLNSGVYFYKLEANGIDGSEFTSIKKMMLTK
jgi:hypothetical protein